MRVSNPLSKPALKPERPWFSSGPCAKPPGWDPGDLKGAFVGRSHRHPEGRARLREVIETSRRLLGLPPDHRLAIIPGSDTGAVETALWNLLGHTGVEVCAWENFGLTWLHDIVEQLRVPDVTVHCAASYGGLPDLSAVDFSRDVVFTWNGTTSGVRVPDADWIPADRDGLTICDATSAVFGMDVDFAKLDVVTWSWQKALGGEGAHGMLALSPAAVERLAVFRPDRPIPKVFRIARDGALLDEVFDGFFVNSPSMLAVEDVLTALDWVERIGGTPATVARSRANLDAVARWVRATPYVEFLAEDPRTVSPTSICLRFTHPRFTALPAPEQAAFARRVCARIEENGAGYDIGAHREAPPGLRIWGGPTVDTADVEALLPWIDWAFAQTLGEYA
ncbi:phosphoserine transaminase [Streptomyces mobaraensis NBRC 13819 = DSM 40847]|uniref:phosphoserine transaminase n=1 Tax=Streptomyces mobaraensis (strain ATCC 29032 / DSM 40847 / JCM 4168 / NBRC 13819 / NCIMB 11159 / IPCR 16-22) TaxID=1223523 RepID=M3C634_STRM1|nr:phosphoserine transaminase [Streptomyces mobaraensis]EME99405.1 phosphoserine aminotransferase [Streptomyces mobaraensis NBRC 13819 = DSM 40847]QTT77116.1 phosphoserine transaminase [Streptomyces mobaraensis NBRC 13819 = DSM 40847]